MKRFLGLLAGTEAPRFRAQPAPEVFDGCSVLYRGYIANVEALTRRTERQHGLLRL